MEKYIKIDLINPSLINIVNAIRFITGIDIRQKSKKREIVYLKKVYYKIAKDMTAFTLTNIADMVYTDHATVLFHLNDIDYFLRDKKYKEIYDETLKLVKKTIDKGLIKKEKDKVIYFVNEIVEVKEQVEYVTKLVDYSETGIPEYIIKHLMEYSEEELLELFQTRLVPYKRLLDSKNKILQ